MEPLAVEKFPVDTKQISLLFNLHSIQKNKFSTLLFPKSTKLQDSQLVSLRDLRFSMETGLQSLLFWLFLLTLRSFRGATFSGRSSPASFPLPARLATLPYSDIPSSPILSSRRFLSKPLLSFSFFPRVSFSLSRIRHLGMSLSNRFLVTLKLQQSSRWLGEQAELRKIP